MPGEMVLAPIQGALAPYLSATKLSFDNTGQQMDVQLNNQLGIWRMFMCPSVDVVVQPSNSNQANDPSFIYQATVLVITGGGHNYPWSTNTDYGFNEGVFGFDYRSQYMPRRLGG